MVTQQAPPYSYSAGRGIDGNNAERREPENYLEGAWGGIGGARIRPFPLGGRSGGTAVGRIRAAVKNFPLVMPELRGE